MNRLLCFFIKFTWKKPNDMPSPQAVANFFITKSRDEEVSLDQMKIQKLVYFAQGWSLAILHRPLFNEPIQSWRFGPVIESLYHEFKDFGNEPVTRKAKKPTLLGKLITPKISDDDEETIALLDRVWQRYNEYSGLELSTLTHEEGSPWQLARERRRTLISVPSMRTYFEGLLQTG